MTSPQKKFDAAKTTRIILGLIDIRRRDLDKEFNRAKEAREYSKLPGFHAMVEALASSARHVSTEKLTFKKDFVALAERFHGYFAESNQVRDAAFENERYADAAGHDGAGTGWLIAKKVILDEIKTF